MLIETEFASLGRALILPASHLFRHGSFIDFHLSHVLLKTEGGREVMSCHVICCIPGEPCFVGRFGSKDSKVRIGDK